MIGGTPNRVVVISVGGADQDDNFDTTSGAAADPPKHDARGNMTHDGQYAFAYDAWNRMTGVRGAYRDGSGNLLLTSTVGTITYDGLGRRICKDISNSADWNYTYNYYHNGQSCVEERNASGQVIRQPICCLTHIDILLQLGLNQAPGDPNEQFCERCFLHRFTHRARTSRATGAIRRNAVGTTQNSWNNKGSSGSRVRRLWPRVGVLTWAIYSVEQAQATFLGSKCI